jgi:hypothetical protein
MCLACDTLEFATLDPPESKAVESTPMSCDPEKPAVEVPAVG